MLKIDVIVTFFNGSKFFQEQLDSILKSKIPEDFELAIIIVNDASKADETMFLRTLCQGLKNVSIHENRTNLGVIKSFEKGISLSTAPYIMLADQDDVWLPTKILDTIQYLQTIEEEGPALVFTDLHIVDEALILSHHSMINYYKFDVTGKFHGILFNNFVTGCTVAFNRKLAEAILPFPSKLVMHDHWLALCAAYMGRLELLNHCTILYRQHSSNQIGAPNNSFAYKLLQFRKQLERFNFNLPLKIAQILALAENLKSDLERGRFLREVARRLERGNLLDCYYLYKKGVIKNAWHTITLRALFPFLKRISP